MAGKYISVGLSKKNKNVISRINYVPVSVRKVSRDVLNYT